MVFKMLKSSYECGNKIHLPQMGLFLCLVCNLSASVVAALGEFFVRCVVRDVASSCFLVLPGFMWRNDTVNNTVQKFLLFFIFK